MLPYLFNLVLACYHYFIFCYFRFLDFCFGEKKVTDGRTYGYVEHNGYGRTDYWLGRTEKSAKGDGWSKGYVEKSRQQRR